jgi:two-component system, cell cycle sensor histidine kinase and response regulator CckA
MHEPKAGEERFPSVAEHAFDMIAWLDGEGRYLYANSAYEQVLGHRPELLLGQVAFDLVHADDRERARRLFAAGLESTPTVTTVLRLLHRDGGERLVEHRARFLVDGRDAPRVLIVARDVTEQQRLERDRRELLADLRRSQQIARLGTWRLRLSDQTFSSSEEANLMLGLPADARPSFLEVMACMVPEDVGHARVALQRLLATGEPYAIDIRFRRMDNGDLRHITSIGELERDAEDRPVAVFGTNQDITDRKLAELERASLGAQLLQAQKLESVGRLAGGVAHDYNNMLSVILLHTELAMTGLDAAHPLYQCLREISLAAERSAALTRQLLAFARRQAIAPRIIDLNATMGGMLSMLRRLIGEQITLDWRPDPAAWSVKLDPAQVDQMLANLCVNARDAIAGSGRILIETRCVTHATVHEDCPAGDYVVVRVSDDGRGMDAATLAHIFEPFYTSKEMGKGTGLGLATVHGIVRQNHGFIEVTSAPGRGTSFAIHLPRCLGEPKEAEIAFQSVDAYRGRETILLVEDEVAILAVTGRMLADLGYEIIAAGTPAEALRLSRARAGRIDLLVTDVVMPGMNGQELSVELGRERPQLRCLFTSGYPSDVISSQGFVAEGLHFLQKPFTIITLARTIRAVLDES